MQKPSEIVGRAREWQLLQRAYQSDRAELVFVLGRRRVGKSFVLAPFARAASGLYYQATRRTETEQLHALSRITAERFDDSALRQTGGFSEWESFFRYLKAKVGPSRFLLVIDEFPYLEEAAPALPSILQSLFDHELSTTRIKLVLSGSHITAMKRLEEVDQPLYARRTARIAFEPFSYFQAAQFVPSYGPQDRLRAYGIFGGLAGHLALLSPDAALADNVQRHVLDASGRLFDEAQRLLDAFVADSAVHYSIIEAIATGDRTWSGITKRLGKSAGSLSRPMASLIDMGLVRRDTPISVPRPSKSKRALYSLTDPYLSFWHRFVAPLAESGMTALAPRERIWKRIASALDDHMGDVFEEVCRNALRERPGLAPFEPSRVGSWWSADSREQLDLVALSDSGEILAGECKWGSVGRSDLATLQRRAELLSAELGGAKRIHLALFSGSLFSGSGVADDGVRAAVAEGRARLLTATDLFVER